VAQGVGLQKNQKKSKKKNLEKFSKIIIITAIIIMMALIMIMIIIIMAIIMMAVIMTIMGPTGRFSKIFLSFFDF